MSATMQNSPVDITKIYHDYTKDLNNKNRENRYEGKEHWYHASGAGSCSRKLYFESVEQAEPTNPMDERTYRLLRLGTMVHDDFEKALILVYIYKVKKKKRKKKKSFSNFILRVRLLLMN